MSRTEAERMLRSTSGGFVRLANVRPGVCVAVCLLGFGLGVAHASGPHGQPGPQMRVASPMHAQVNNRDLPARPAPAVRSAPIVRSAPAAAGGAASVPSRPNAQPHLNEWMNAHRNLPAAEQHHALEAEPGFHELKPEEQQRMHNLVTRLNSMSPGQRQRTLARTEWMEHLAPGQRQQVRSAMAQLGGLPQDRSYAVGRAFRSLQAMPGPERQSYLNSPQFRAQFNDQERGTLNNLLNVSPLLPPPTLGSAH